jgi:predicted hotdog family 3-hydroxylacyl-ACP dehydratase
MCLLDEVLGWDAAGIRCRTATHRAADHPLRAHGRLGSACGIEYAAQAMALHGALLAAAGATAASAGATHRDAAHPVAAHPENPSGYLASVRGVRMRVSRLDDIAADLICTAIRVHGDLDAVVYDFVVAAASHAVTEVVPLLSGRATIVLRSRIAGRPAPTARGAGTMNR